MTLTWAGPVIYCRCRSNGMSELGTRQEHAWDTSRVARESDRDAESNSNNGHFTHRKILLLTQPFLLCRTL